MMTGEKSKFKGGGLVYAQTSRELSKQWDCHPRHASKVRRGVTTVKCAKNCACPLAMAKLEAATKPEAKVA